MEELIKMLNIKEINYIFIYYTDNHGNFKQLRLDYIQENKDE